MPFLTRENEKNDDTLNIIPNTETKSMTLHIK